MSLDSRIENALDQSGLPHTATKTVLGVVHNEWCYQYGYYLAMLEECPGIENESDIMDFPAMYFGFAVGLRQKQSGVIK